MSEQNTHNDLQLLLDLLPHDIQHSIKEHGRETDLLEVVMDLGRRPSARYTDGEQILREEDITQAEIDTVVAGLGDFDDDNRAGIARTLHRISGMRNRRGDVVGLTCRVGRAVYGTSDIIQDIIHEGKSMLLLGRPGVGKTTMLREVARILADNKRVVIVDTSNEIGGDGDIPHRAVGRARRMQVPKPAFQHETMIEAVENHNPEVIIIDEIGREAEAAAARTINERGVQLVGTAHGNTLDNLLLNPTLSDLVGGIESVTLSDDEARRRGTQKTVLERRAPPTFDVVIEIQDREHVVIHPDVTEAVDNMLYGQAIKVEQRYRDESGEMQAEQATITELPSALSGRRGGGLTRGTRGRVVPRSTGRDREDGLTSPTNGHVAEQVERDMPRRALNLVGSGDGESERKPLRIFSYGVARNRLYQAARHLQINIEITDDMHQAEVLVTLKSYYRRRRRLISDAEQRRIPIYVLRANTLTQMENFLIEATGLEVTPTDPFDEALDETRLAIERVQAGAGRIDLKPANSFVRREQHELARASRLISQSYGQGPSRHVRIYNPDKM
ncbi:MAG: AAA family ATPase [Anaerolineales bacterium]|nr:AAA family ATPase [Anaerolineales bacterium]